MEKIIEILLKRINFSLFLVGTVLVLISVLRIEEPSKFAFNPLEKPQSIIVMIIGIVIIAFALVGIWQKMQIENQNSKLSLGNNDLLNLMKPAEDAVDHYDQIIKCDGILNDLYIGDAEKVDKMPEERRWTYEIQDIIIKIWGDKLSLEYKALVNSPHCKKTEVYLSYGSGIYNDGVAHILYSYKKVDKDAGCPNWIGNMVLRVPKRGKIIGYWITTNVNADNKFPFGTIILVRK